MQCFNQISVQLLTVTYEFESRRPPVCTLCQLWSSANLGESHQLLEFPATSEETNL